MTATNRHAQRCSRCVQHPDSSIHGPDADRAPWNFDFAPEEVYLGSTIYVTGTIALCEGSAEMIIEGPEWIWVP
jgi:hypothetical protein